MPFTFSHPAIVLPLAKYFGRYISLTGLIIGSLIPDFEYFFRMKIQSNFSHTIGGLFYLNLPVGIIFAFIFHNLIRNTLYDNLPWEFRKRLEIFKACNWNDYFRHCYLIVIISVLVGAASHLLWDSFTHMNGYSVQIFSFLRETIKIAGHDIQFYKLLQHFSTLIGGLYIAFTFYKLPTNETSKQKTNLRYWFTSFAIVVLIVFIRLAFTTEKNIIGQLLVTTISAILIALMILPTFTRKRI